MLLTDKYADKIYGTLTCYDRMIIQGYVPRWSYAEGMTSYLNVNNIRIFDYSSFSQPISSANNAAAPITVSVVNPFLGITAPPFLTILGSLYPTTVRKSIETGIS